MKEEQTFRKVVFLDTNTLHCIGIYLEYAKESNLFPWHSEDIEKEKDEAKEHVNNLTEAGFKKSLKQGLEAVYWLSTKEVQVQYEHVSELELLVARTKGKAIVSAANEGLPDRIWSRFPEKEIRERVGPIDLGEIKNKIDNLTFMLEESGVAVTTGQSNQTREFIELAKGINGLVYLDAMDSIIYASAIVVQADYLFTMDGYLKTTVNYIHNPWGKPRYEEIRRQLRQLVSQIILGNADDVVLPSAHTVTADGTLKPNLPASGAGSSS